MPALLPSELPVRYEARHHWIVLLRAPHKWIVLFLAALLVASILRPFPFAWALGVLVVSGFLLRWQNWRAERILLTGRRLIRVQGVIETTRTESSLRLDRIAGARLVEPVAGKLFGYGTIELEAPGDNELLSRMERVDGAAELYLRLRPLIFGDEDYDPETGGPHERAGRDERPGPTRPAERTGRTEPTGPTGRTERTGRFGGPDSGRHHRTERLPHVTPPRAAPGAPARRSRRAVIRGDD